MMNQGVVQSSGSPNWWSINNMRPPLHHQLTAPLTLTPPLNAATSSWNDGQELPDSWSQLLLGGLVGEEDKSIDMIHMRAKKLENWEEQFLKHQSTLNTFGVDVIKQENNSYTYNPAKNVDQFQMVSASSPKSCVTTTLSSNMFDFSNKTSDVKHPKPDPSSYECNSKGTGGAAKKPRIQASSPQSTFKVRKEKLGDRITALHQLVSPFGKTDTASVLLEAIGYIRFLQSQIEALSVPYLGSESANMSHNNPFGGESNCLFPEDSGQLLNEKCMKRKGLTSDQACDGEEKKGLRSRGLCVVPVSCTLQVGSDNGADYWAPAFGGN